MSRSAKNEPLWSASVEMPECPALGTNVEADVCIVGAGIAGLTTAYLLMKAGKSVVLLDDGPLAGGMTAATTAHLSSALDDTFVNIESWHGEEAARLAAQSHADAINRIEGIANELGADCDFQRLDGYLFRSPGDPDDLLDRELAAARRARLADAEMVPRAPLQPFDSGRAIRFPNQARFHPLKYLAAVARAVKEMGGRIFTLSHADRIEGGAAAKVEVGRHTVRSAAIVVATNTPINDLVAIHTKQAPYMTYAIGARVPRGSVTDALYWETRWDYHYVRLQPERGALGGDEAAGKGDLLIVGGEDHKSGQADDTDERHARLEAWARERFPMMGGVEYTWGGQYMETFDGLAFIGRNPMDDQNVFIVTGDSGMGITHGTIAGMLLTDLICGRPNPWQQLYDPSRKTLRAAGRFLQENLNVARQYADWVTAGEVESADEIRPGSGAVVRSGLAKLAVYRDHDGGLTRVSAVCPHLKCIVQWNATESTWDCPCHGSRFKAAGQVINGPANCDLRPAQAD